MTQPHERLKSLGAKTELNYRRPDPAVLEWFENPFADGELNRNGAALSIHIEAPEFTTLCPKTGQPDFGAIVIDYIPRERCIESKSLKLYLAGFRMFGEFHEAAVNRIANDLADLLDPVWLRVEGRFTPRGGIKFWPVAEIGQGR